MSIDTPRPGAGAPALARAELAPPETMWATLRGKIAIYRKLWAVPENRTVSPLIAVTRVMDRAPDVVPVVSEQYRRRRSALFERDLRLLNDVLADSPLAGHYWVWGGMLLGWAREGRLLPHDTGDADFGFAAQDAALFDQAEAQLLAAGFTRGFRFHSRAGVCTERVVVRHGFKFEFFRMDAVDPRTYAFHVYGLGRTGPVEVVGHLPVEELEPFDFLGRTWMKPRDHDLLLRTCYGDWHTPDASWEWFDDLSLVSARAWSTEGGAAV
jgi:hypothetical protein